MDPKLQTPSQRVPGTFTSLGQGAGGVQANLHSSNKINAPRQAGAAASFLEKGAWCIHGMMEGLGEQHAGYK